MQPRRPFPLSSQETKGFTLVELLVVIGIVGVLAALCLPGMQNALIKANQSKSVNNLRSIGSGVAAYLADNDNRYPYQCGVDYVEPYWSKVITPYLSAATGQKNAYGETIEVSPSMIDPMMPAGRHHNLGDYGCNNWIFVNPKEIPVQVSAGVLTRASEIVIVMTSSELDNSGQRKGSWYVNASYFAWSGVYDGPVTSPSYRVTGNVLSLFADGHAQAIPKDEFQANRWRYMSIEGQQPN